jgi:hypothetical protein
LKKAGRKAAVGPRGRTAAGLDRRKSAPAATCARRAQRQAAVVNRKRTLAVFAGVDTTLGAPPDTESDSNFEECESGPDSDSD